MDTHEHLSAHEHPWTHMNSCFSKYNAAGKLLVEPYVSQFLNFLFWVVGYVSFWFNYSFLELNINFIFMFYLFLFCPVVASRPEKDPCWFLQNMICHFVFLKLSIYSYLFLQIYLYIYTYVYVYINIYLHIYMCIYIYMCVCVCQFMYLYIYIYKSVCVCGGGCLKMRCPFFLSKNPFWNQKNTSFWDIHVYTIYLFFDMCFFVSILCWFVPSKIYDFCVSFVQYVVFSASFYRKKCIKSKNVPLEIAI